MIMFSYGRTAVTLLALFTSLATPATANPVDSRSILQARADALPQSCPTAEYIADYLKKKHPNWTGANTVFYSKPATAASAGVLARQKGGEYYGSLVTNDMILDFVDMCGPGTEQDKIVPRVSEAIALDSTGTAYVILDPAHPPATSSIWSVNEFPTLKKHGKVHEVIEHDYGTGKEHKIWP